MPMPINRVRIINSRRNKMSVNRRKTKIPTCAAINPMGTVISRAFMAVSSKAPLKNSSVIVVLKIATLKGCKTARVSALGQGRIDNQMAGIAPETAAAPPSRPPTKPTVLSMYGVCRENAGSAFRKLE